MIKVLAFAEAGIRTGFERVQRQIMTYLNDQPDFDVTVIGIGYTGQPEIPRYPYPVYGASFDAMDQIGARTIQKVIDRHKPDVVWILHDLWQINTYMAFKQCEVPVVVYFPVDTPNMKWSFTVGLSAVTRAAVYTKFGATETAAGVRDAVALLTEGLTPEQYMERRRWLNVPHPMGTKLRGSFERLGRYQNLDAYSVIPHGLDTTLFTPRSKAEARKLFNMPADAFVVGNINANQFRKRQDIVFRAFAQLAAKAPNARLVMHCAGHTISGWDLQQLARYYGVQDRVWFVHESKYELEESELVNLYNCLDVMINPAGGEGWGLSSAEGAACGVPQIVTDWGPSKELWTDHGVLLPVQDYRIEPKYLNTCHAEVNVKAAGDILIDLWQHPEKRAQLSERALEFAAKQWSWAQVGGAMEAVIRDALNDPPPAWISFANLVDMRVGDVRSQLERTPLFGADAA